MRVTNISIMWTNPAQKYEIYGSMDGSRYEILAPTVYYKKMKSENYLLQELHTDNITFPSRPFVKYIALQLIRGMEDVFGISKIRLFYSETYSMIVSSLLSGGLYKEKCLVAKDASEIFLFDCIESILASQNDEVFVYGMDGTIRPLNNRSLCIKLDFERVISETFFPVKLETCYDSSIKDATNTKKPSEDQYFKLDSTVRREMISNLNKVEIETMRNRSQFFLYENYKLKLFFRPNLCLTAKDDYLQDLRTFLMLSEASDTFPDGNHLIENIFDGTSDTYWACNYNPKGKIVLNIVFKKKLSLNGIRISWAFPPKVFQIFYSKDTFNRSALSLDANILDGFALLYENSQNTLAENIVSFSEIEAITIKIIVSEPDNLKGHFEGVPLIGIKILDFLSGSILPMFQECGPEPKKDFQLAFDNKQKWYFTDSTFQPPEIPGGKAPSVIFTHKVLLTGKYEALKKLMPETPIRKANQTSLMGKLSDEFEAYTVNLRDLRNGYLDEINSLKQDFPIPLIEKIVRTKLKKKGNSGKSKGLGLGANTTFRDCFELTQRKGSFWINSSSECRPFSQEIYCDNSLYRPFSIKPLNPKINEPDVKTLGSVFAKLNDAQRIHFFNQTTFPLDYLCAKKGLMSLKIFNLTQLQHLQGFKIFEKGKVYCIFSEISCCVLKILQNQQLRRKNLIFQ